MRIQSTMRLCSNCCQACPGWFAKGLCKNCHGYLRRHGVARPVKIPPSKRACIHCGQVGVEAKERCHRCYQYFSKHRMDRPDSVDKHAEAAAMGLRYCRYCDQALPLDRFYRSSVNGLQNECRDCKLERQKRSTAEKAKNREPVIRNCVHCGESFTVSIYRRDAMYCSRACKCVHWKTLNPERRREIGRLRSARERGAKVGVVIDRQAIFERDGWMCQLCGLPVDPTIPAGDRMSKTLDHIIPVSKGGVHTPDNLQLAHLCCNASKKDRLT